MFEISVESHFDAAHALRNYHGDCARLHGHTWSVTVTLTSKETGENGFVMDFNTVDEILNRVLSRFDHINLNELEEFKETNPTAENLARILYKLLDRELSKNKVRISSVTVGESPHCRVKYTEE